MRVLIACEESQEVCKAFRARGHEAYSCDLQACSGGHPEWHFQMDAIDALYRNPFMVIGKTGYLIEFNGPDWDLVIAHPPCDRLTYAGVRWLDERNLWDDLKSSIEFFREFQEYGTRGNKIAIENPIPHKYARDGFWLDRGVVNVPLRVSGIGKYDQKFHPYQFGHKQMKSTCLWLYGLPELRHTDTVGPPPKDKTERNKWHDVHRKMGNVPERKIFRSKTFPGIARAMAEQWG